MCCDEMEEIKVKNFPHFTALHKLMPSSPVKMSYREKANCSLSPYHSFPGVLAPVYSFIAPPLFSFTGAEQPCYTCQPPVIVVCRLQLQQQQQYVNCCLRIYEWCFKTNSATQSICSNSSHSVAQRCHQNHLHLNAR